jgi:hypothetical protein
MREPILCWAPAVWLEALHTVYGVDTSQPPYAIRLEDTEDGWVLTMPAADVTIDIRAGRHGDQDWFNWSARDKATPNAHDAAVMGHALEVLLEACGVLVPPDAEATH